MKKRILLRDGKKCLANHLEVLYIGIVLRNYEHKRACNTTFWTGGRYPAAPPYPYREVGVQIEPVP